MLINALACILVLLVAFKWWKQHLYLARLDHIPGHSSWTSLPFIGHLYRLGRTPVEELHKHRRRFGDVFRLDSGPLPSIFLCNYEQMNKVLKQDATAGRPHHLIPGYVLSSGTDAEGKLYGIAIASGKTWAEQRRFFSQYLASSKNKFDDVIGEEAKSMCQEISESIGPKGDNLEINNLFMKPVNYVLWRMITGKTIDKEKLGVLIHIIREFFRISERSGISEILQMTTYWAVPMYKFLGYRDTILDKYEPLKKFLAETVSSFTKPDVNGNLIERHQVESMKATPGSSFYGSTGTKNLEAILESLLLAGTDTVSAFLEWFCMYMTSFPDVQERCFEELEKAMGSRTPSLADKANTPYFEATLLEITRHCPHLALTVQHQAVEEFEVGGYKIPKETQVFYSVVSVLHDPKYFPEPSVFRPDRFINNAGEFVPDEKVIYFGTGKRRCVGEILGRAEMYIFGAALIKAFKFLYPNGQRPDIHSYRPGLNMHIKEFRPRVVHRF